MSKKLKKVSIMAMAAIFISQLLVSDVSIKATEVDNALSLSRVAVNSKGESGTNINVKVGEEVNINYTINSSTISSSVTQAKSKKIVLVIDTSSSMGITDMKNPGSVGSGNGNTRLKAAIDSAKKFVDKFPYDTNYDTEIAVVTFSDYATVRQGFTSDRIGLKKAINDLKFERSGGTNIGDGLRTAYNMLSPYSDTFSKYVILLTDGQPNVWSYTGSDTSNYYYGPNSYYTFYNNNKYDVNYSLGLTDNNDSQGKALAYSIGMAQKMPIAKHSTFIVGFSADVDMQKLQKINDSAKGRLNIARGTTSLSSVYENIASEIINELVVTNMSFEETFPSNIEIVSLPEGLRIENSKIVGSLKNARYTLVNGKYQLAEPINFTIKIKFKTGSSGTYNLPQTQSFISYRDYNNIAGSKNFNSLSFNLSDIVPRITKAPIIMDRAMTNSKYRLMNGTTEDISINYSVKPSDVEFYKIAPENYFQEKYVVVVADNSGSMSELVNGKTRLNALKDTLIASNGFINRFEGNNRVNIALVGYSYYGTPGNDLSEDQTTKIKDAKGNIQDFADMSDANQVGALKKQITSMEADGATNIGDGLRTAYWLLNKVNTNAKKYVVLMTDGIPTAFSFVNNTLYYYSTSDIIGGLVDKIDYSTDTTLALRKFISVELNYADGEATNYAWNSGSNDYGNYGYTYSRETAKLLAGKNVNSYIVGFSDGVSATKLTQIAEDANNGLKGRYKEAQTAADLEGVYKDIAVEIEKDIPVGSLSFSAELPAGLQFKSIVKDGAVIDGFTTRTVNGKLLVEGSLDKLGSITYKLNDAKTHFVAQPINFSLVVRGNVAKTYDLLKASTFVKYMDIDKTETTLYSSNDISFEIVNNPSAILNHGIFADKPNSLVGESFTESLPGQSVAAVNNIRYNAGVLLEANNSNTSISITIDRRNVTSTQDVIVKVYKINADGTYNRNTTATASLGTPSLANGVCTINVTIPETGKYLITYSFMMKAQSENIDFINSAQVDGASKNLMMRINPLPEIF